jgi:hypothetical protein
MSSRPARAAHPSRSGGVEDRFLRVASFLFHFNQPGVVVYYCRFHAYLDASNQPAAPGPNGGIQDANGNYGRPMMGVITVVP